MSLSEIQTCIRRAHRTVAAGAMAELVSLEASKGCCAEISPVPVSLEPTFTPLRQWLDVRSAPRGHSMPLERPPAPEEMQRKIVWISPDQQCRWEDSEQFLKSLASAQNRIVFEVVGNCREVSFRLASQRVDWPQLRTAFNGQFGSCRLTDMNFPVGRVPMDIADSGFIFAEFCPTMPYYRRFTEPDEFACSPLKTLLASLKELPESMQGIYQVMFQPAGREHFWHDNVRFLQDLEYRFHTNAGLLSQQQYAQQIPSSALSTVAGWLENKAHNDKPFFFAVIRIGLTGAEADREEHLHALATFLCAYQHGGRQLRAIRERAFADVLSPDKFHRLFADAWTYREGILLNSSELASLVHLPPLSTLSDLAAPLQCLEPLADLPSHVMGTRIGVCSVAGTHVPVFLPSEIRMSHVHILGVPGKGKSTLIKNMCMQDIVRGHGVAVLDPHGSLVADLIGLIPQKHAERIVYLHFDDPEWVPTWNPLTLLEGVAPGVIADEIIRAFKSMMTGWGDRLEHLLRHAILGLLHLPGSTMFDVSTLLSKEPKEGERMIRAIRAATSNRLIRRFWKEDFPKYKAADLSPPQHKLSKLLASGAVGAMLAQPDSLITLRDVMDSGKILLVDLSNMGTDLCSAVGSLMLSLIYTAAISRGGDTTREFPPFHLCVDEAHRFVQESLSNIIDETRKFRVSLTLAHQRYSQFDRGEREALSDCRTSIYFALNREDARRTAGSLHKEISAEDLMALERGKGFAQIDGKTVRFETSLPEPPEKPCRREDVIAYSHQRYYRRASDIRQTAKPWVVEDAIPGDTGGQELIYDEF